MLTLDEEHESSSARENPKSKRTATAGAKCCMCMLLIVILELRVWTCMRYCLKNRISVSSSGASMDSLDGVRGGRQQELNVVPADCHRWVRNELEMN